MAKTDEIAPRLKVDAELFGMAYRFVAQDETRYYLNGVYIKPHPAGGVMMVATNGRIMGITYDREGEINGSPVIMPVPDYVRNNLDRGGTVIIEGDVGKVLDRNENTAALFEFAPIDGVFPDWRRLFPATMPEPQTIAGLSLNAGFDPKFRVKGQETKVNLYPTEISKGTPTGPIIVTIDDVDFIGLWMPCLFEPMTGFPDWFERVMRPTP